MFLHRTGRTLPAEAYTSHELFDWERRSIFAGTWTALGRLDDLLAPGQLRGIEHGGESVLLAFPVQGSVLVSRHDAATQAHDPGEVGPSRIKSRRRRQNLELGTLVSFRRRFVAWV